MSDSFGYVDDVDEVDLTHQKPVFRRTKMPCSSDSVSRFSRRRPKSAKQAHGIHRRRRKKIQW